MALVVVAVAGSAVSLAVGSRWVAPDVVWATLTAHDPTDAAQAVVAARIPRTVLALLAGGALGLAGAATQGLTRNPLGDPGILGVNAGASLAMVTAIALLGVTSLSGYIWFALLGAALAAVVVHGIAGLGGDGSTPGKLAVAGAAVTAGSTSWTSALLLSDRQTLDVFRFWQVGTVGGRGMDVVVPVLPFLAAGGVLALCGSRVLDVMALGEDVARALGRRAWLDRTAVGAAVVLLAGSATALAGPLVFVGLVAPHVARLVVGSSHRRVLPASLGLGAVLVLFADVLGRVVLPPTEVQVGIMVAVLGVPVFLTLVRRGRMGTL